MKSKKQKLNVTYHEAPQKETLLKTRQTYFEKFSVFSCLFGIISIIGGVGGLFYMKPFIKNMIASDMSLRQHSRAFQEWRDPSLKSLMKIYFFNLTNQQSFIAGEEKPQFNKVGPYSYYQEIHRVQPMFSSDGQTVTFSDNQTYFFSPEHSSGQESDVLLLPNIPLFGAMRNLTNQDSTTKNIFEDLISSYNFEKEENVPFMMLSVKEFLWNYPSLLMTIKHSESEDCSKDDYDDWNVDEDFSFDESFDDEEAVDECSISEKTLQPFGFFMGQNNTVIYPRTLMTGISDIQNKGLLKSAFGKERLGSWPEDRCNVIQGRDPECPTINIDQHESMDLYFVKMCRGITFNYTQTVIHAGLETLRFSPLENTFNSPIDTPENSCYCLGEDCLPSGVLDLGLGCNPGSPVYMSWPHFLHGDKQLREQISGIDPPSPALHSFYLDYSPTWGIPLSVHARLQFNVLVENNGFSYFSNIKSPLVLPFLYIDAGFEEPTEDLVNVVKVLLEVPEKVMKMTVGVGVSLGLLCLVPILVLRSSQCWAKIRGNEEMNRVEEGEGVGVEEDGGEA